MLPKNILRLLFLCIVVSSLLVSCSFAAETPARCQPSKIQVSENDFHEIRADMQSDGSVWALLFFENARVNEDAKIVWRITGEVDELEAEARSEQGIVLTPIWKEYHGGSNWQRPGQEWGTGFNFPEPGCWTITVKRGETTGTISLDVFPSP